MKTGIFSFRKMKLHYKIVEMVPYNQTKVEFAGKNRIESHRTRYLKTKNFNYRAELITNDRSNARK